MKTFYNLVFTSVPIVFVAVFDQDVPERIDVSLLTALSFVARGRFLFTIPWGVQGWRTRPAIYEANLLVVDSGRFLPGHSVFLHSDLDACLQYALGKLSCPL